MKKINEIIIYGRGGQGAKTTAEIIAQSALLEDKFVQAFPEFGPERSGAPVQTFVRISDKPIRTRQPVVNPICFMVLDETLLEVFEGFSELSKDSHLIINTKRSQEEVSEETGFKGNLVLIDASSLSMEIVGENRPNTVILGKFSAVTGLVKLENITKMFRIKYQEKIGAEKTDKNINAIEAAYEKNKENKKEERELGGAIENKKENYPPTGEWSQEKPEISDECISCAQCMRFCPEGVISIKEVNGKRRAVVDLEFCKGCGICIGQCPVKAIKMKEV